MDYTQLSHRELLEIIKKHKDMYIKKFLLEHGNDDLSGYSIDLHYYDNYGEQFDHFETIEDFTTLEDLLKDVNNTQIDRGGSWQVSFNDDEKDEYKWFEISETGFEWDF